MAKPLRLLAQFLVSIITIEIVLLLLLLLSSCAHAQFVAMPSTHQRDSTTTQTKTITQTSTIDRWHSLIQRGDTIYKTDSIYVEKVHDVEVHDTVMVVRRDSVPYPVEVIREVPSPIPRAYRYSMWFTILAIIFLIFYIMLRIYLRR